jgi:hypothetical protein
LLFLYGMQVTGVGAVVGHVRFDQIDVCTESGIDIHAYAHYLHRQYFEVSYAGGAASLDKRFGVWHNGSPEAETRTGARCLEKVARTNRE